MVKSRVVVSLANMTFVDYDWDGICQHFVGGFALCRHFLGCEDLMFWSKPEAWVASVGLLLFSPIFCRFLRC